MNIVTLPTRYGSAFHPACFSLAGVQAPNGVDIEIYSPGRPEPLGVKRIYSSTTASVDVAPYARRLLAPEPMCGSGPGIYVAPGRSALCFISAPGLSSEAVVLCGGTENSPSNTLLSAAPPTVKIAPGERDEMGLISQDWVVPVVTFRRGSVSYSDLHMGQRNAEGILAAVIDADTVCRAFTQRTGASAGELEEFTVRLTLEQAGFAERIVERHYIVDHTAQNGRRLAWLNRYGAVDYHTFPTVEEFRSGGGRTRIETPAGYRTVATRSNLSLRLLSEPCDARAAGWLSEIFSSPAVWMISGSEYERVEVAAGEVVCPTLRPAIVSVVVSPSVPNVSRKI